MAGPALADNCTNAARSTRTRARSSCSARTTRSRRLRPEACPGKPATLGGHGRSSASGHEHWRSVPVESGRRVDAGCHLDSTGPATIGQPGPSCLAEAAQQSAMSVRAPESLSGWARSGRAITEKSTDPCSRGQRSDPGGRLVAPRLVDLVRVTQSASRSDALPAEVAGCQPAP